MVTGRGMESARLREQPSGRSGPTNNEKEDKAAYKPGKIK